MTAKVYDSVVLGAGPAGVACAVGLARLGLCVALVGRPRARSVEGLSARTLERLTGAGLAEAARCVSSPRRRLSIWGGAENSDNVELVVDRLRFDAGLGRDAKAHGIDICVRGVRAYRQRRGHWQIDLSEGRLHGRSIVEARGRRPREFLRRGPRLAAYSQSLRTVGKVACATASFPLDDGWCWLAATGEDQWTIQFVGEPRRSRQCPLLGTIATMDGVPASIATVLEDSVAQSDISVRAATAGYTTPAAAAGIMRIGDACMAMDPLSGHGIFEALTSAHVGTAVINTYLKTGSWQTAAQFANERAEEIWRRKLKTAAQFYALQGQASGLPFWQKTATQYAMMSASPAGPLEPRFEVRPVLDNAEVVLRRVLVTPERARGIWRINGQEIDPHSYSIGR